MRTALPTLVSFITAMSLFGAPARAHSWYPNECCNDTDCAPIESIARFVPTGGGTPQLLITSPHGTVIVPEDYPVRESKDGRMHVCMRHSLSDPFGDMGIVCLFMPPNM